jgi:RNA polymerase primary sigma factor
MNALADIKDVELEDDELEEFEEDLAEMDDEVNDEEFDAASILTPDIPAVYASEISRYLSDISVFPRLTQEEEIELAKLIEAGVEAKAKIEANDKAEMPSSSELYNIVATGQNARDKFINANYKLVVSIAKKYMHATNPGLTFLDLIQNGNLGLMKSVDRFDYTKGFKFSTFATWWIRQSIMREILNTATTIRIPVHLQEWISRLNRLEHANPKITIEEIAKELDVTVDKVMHFIQVRDTMYVTSLDHVVKTPDSDSTLLELIVGDSLPPDTVHNLEQRELGLLNLMADKLTDREFYVISRRYGLLGETAGTLEVIGAEVGVTRERVRQIEAKVLKKLRLPNNQEYLKDLLTLK